MDFIKSLLPPLRIPKLKKLKQWNGGSILNLSQLTRLPSRTRNVGTVPSVATPTASFSRSGTNSAVASISNGTKGHVRKRSDISTISAAVPSVAATATAGHGSLGLYALKCDRNAAKRGILLNLPRKMVAAVGGDVSSGSCYQSEEMVHEKFSPCKRAVEPPPRRKRMRKRQEQQPGRRTNPMRARDEEMYLGDQMLERNRSELFRIAERGSNGHEDQKVAPGRMLNRGRKTRSVDNILTLKKLHHEAGVESDSDVDQVRSLKVGKMQEWKESKGLKYSESMESDSEEAEKMKKNVRGRLKQASDFSIENNSDKIEVRFRKSESVESEEVAKPLELPLPNRVVVLRQEGAKSEVKIKPKLPDNPPPKKVEKFVSSVDFADNFKPLASVLQESIKSSELKRKWINDFLSESDEESGKPKPAVVGLNSQQSTVSFSKKFALVNKFDKQLEALETGKKLVSNESNDSVNIFQKTNADFEEFDKLFRDGQSVAQLQSLDIIRKSVTESQHITYINQLKADQLRFSSSSMDSDARIVPIPPPLPPPAAPKSPTNGAIPKSTVKIQDYYDKNLQRVRYVSSPSPSRCFDEDSSTEQTEAVNNNIVLPLSIINHTTVDNNRITAEQVSTSATKAVVTGENHSVNEPNQNIYPDTYNQPASNDHISCNLHNIDDPSYVGHNQATTRDFTNHSHNVFIVGETFKRSQQPPVVKRYVNYKFDDYCKIDREATKARDPPAAVARVPTRIFNINDFHDNCYNEEGVVII